MKRFLRDLHRGHEKDEREKERAKSEVARLNCLVSGGSGLSANAGGGSSSAFGRGPIPFVPKPHATNADRIQQAAQLAELGVSIPDEFRGDMAMTGDWQVVSERIMDPEADGEKKPDAIGFGVRKRSAHVEEDEDEAPRKKNWNSRYTYPGEGLDNDLDALLQSAIIKVDGAPLDSNVKQETGENAVATSTIPKSEDSKKDATKSEVPYIKREASDDLSLNVVGPSADVKEDPEPDGGGIVFKKRKGRNIRQK